MSIGQKYPTNISEIFKPTHTAVYYNYESESVVAFLLLVLPAAAVSCGYRHMGTLPMKGGASMQTTHQVRHISVSINRTPGEVHAFVSNPENLPKWATGLGGSIKNVQGEWIADCTRFTAATSTGSPVGVEVPW